MEQEPRGEARQSGGHELHGLSLFRGVGVRAADEAAEVRAVAGPTLKVMASNPHVEMENSTSGVNP